ncbi:MAG: 50S ribosomal protein L4 [Clostridia bacterium]|nr:50S ribosomal protein L4 [Clostridia bacterium]MBP5666126.1 50S ribosomal protein L4 [Clostridia bacterium]
MATAKVYNMSGDFIEEITLDENVFGIEPNTAAVHTVVVNTLANRRQGTQSAKTKSEVSGGGKKPYRQKGTGRARQGSIRSAQWIHGGIIFAPKPRSYRFTVNKKVRRLAMLSVLSSRAAEESIIVLDKLELDEIKTKKIVSLCKALKLDTSALLVTADPDLTVVKSARNIPGVDATFVGTINVYDILRHEKLVLTRDALGKLSEVYA